LPYLKEYQSIPYLIEMEIEEIEMENGMEELAC